MTKTKAKDIFKDKPFPKWMVNHPIFKDTDKISKVFPGIGLPNCEDVCAIDNGTSATKSARYLLDRMRANLGHTKLSLVDFKKTKKTAAERIAKIERCKDLVSQVKKKLGKGKAAFISANNGRVALSMPEDITIEGDDNPFIRKGESFFRVYNKINDMLRDSRFATMANLDTIPEFKRFSTDNVPNNKFKIVFSSDGSTGAWDIATMSMRGVQSCQSWDSDYSKSLIGSVADPFVGIIYMTSGSNTKYGSKMIKRCVVRFAINEETRKPFLFLDVMYPNPDEKVLKAFKDFLTKKVQDKIEVHTTKDYAAPVKAYMPLTPFRKKIESYSGEYRDESIVSYQDSAIPSKVAKNKDRQSYLYDKNSKKKEQKFIDKFSKNVVAAFRRHRYQNSTGRYSASHKETEQRPWQVQRPDYYDVQCR